MARREEIISFNDFLKDLFRIKIFIQKWLQSYVRPVVRLVRMLHYNNVRRNETYLKAKYNGLIANNGKAWIFTITIKNKEYNATRMKSS